jgi:hypothetical protein
MLNLSGELGFAASSAEATRTFEKIQNDTLNQPEILPAAPGLQHNLLQVHAIANNFEPKKDFRRDGHSSPRFLSSQLFPKVWYQFHILYTVVFHFVFKYKSSDLSALQNPATGEEPDNVLIKHLCEMEKRIMSSIMEAQEMNERKFEAMGKKLKEISEAFPEADERKSADDAEDRKRLKERLKEALDERKRVRIMSNEFEKEGWLEFLFGICKPDGRIGKAGSR